MKSFQHSSPRKRSARKGQTLVEYSLILAIMTAVAIGVFTALGTRVVLLFSAIDTLLDTAQQSH